MSRTRTVASPFAAALPRPPPTSIRPALTLPSPTRALGLSHVQPDDLSYALGKKGMTRKKLARSSGCIVECALTLALGLEPAC